MVYRLFCLARWLVVRAPLRLSYAGAVLGAYVAWLFMPEQRANASANMGRVLGSGRRRQARRIARRSFVNYAKYLVDFIRLPELTAPQLAERFEFNAWERYDAALAQGRGCILVLMHFGNWDLGGPVLAQRGYAFNAIAETQDHGRLNDDLVAARTKHGVKLIPMEKAATGIIRSMRRNETLAILIDRPLDDGGIEVEFFGAPIRVPAGPARIALRTGAKVIAVSQLRSHAWSDRVRVIADFEIELPNSGDLEHDVRLLTRRILQAHERVIRRHPEQWYMFRRMWPRRTPVAAGRAVAT
ncbi:MAG TPA: lysophospholipid acyltransferase family protein [Dehalococcoidia bacterium]|nr:lysophospholipid acyltransferase family protein [Dehalococcoidia bacterium]